MIGAQAANGLTQITDYKNQLIRRNGLSGRQRTSGYGPYLQEAYPVNHRASVIRITGNAPDAVSLFFYREEKRK